MRNEFDEYIAEAVKNKKTTQEWVTDILRKSILSGYFDEDQPLDTSELAKKLGVSRMPVRIALIQLKNEGLVTLEPHKKAIAAKLSPTEVRQLCDIRCELEALAIRRAISEVTAEDIVSFKQLITKMDHSKDISEFIALNNRFHNQINKLSRNEELFHIIIQLRNRVERYLRIYVSDDFNVKFANKEHKEILKALENQDVDEADRLIRTHLTSTCEGVAKMLERFQR